MAQSSSSPPSEPGCPSSQLEKVASDLRGLNQKLAVDVSRAAEFAHAYERSLYGAAALLETGAAWGPDAQGFLRGAHEPGPLQMHRLSKLFGSCAGMRNCTHADEELEWDAAAHAPPNRSTLDGAKR